MLNKEKYKDKIFEIAVNHDTCGVKNGEVRSCGELNCYECDFYREYCSYDDYAWDWIILYYTKDEILKMQKSMTCNETLLEELLENNKLDGLIVVIN